MKRLKDSLSSAMSDVIRDTDSYFFFFFFFLFFFLFFNHRKRKVFVVLVHDNYSDSIVYQISFKCLFSFCDVTSLVCQM